MKPLVKTVAVSTLIAALTVLSVAPASARDRWGDGEWRPRHHHNGADAAAMGALGLATGLIVGGAIANSGPRYVEPGPVYIDPPAPAYIERRVYVEPQPVYRQRVVVEEPAYYRAAPVRELRPWSNAWYRYCSQRYVSFDNRSGTYIGYDGREHFCTSGG